MTVARSSAKALLSRLPAGKGREVLGFLLLVAGLLLLVSLLSHHPLDPSLLRQTAEDVGARNLIGPFGAQVSALGFGWFGLAMLAAPVFLLLAAGRRLRSLGRPPVAGRGTGSVLLLVALPPLLQLLVGTLRWRGEPLEAGGAAGVFLAGVLEGRLGYLGALLTTAGLFVVALALVVQSSLEAVLRQVGGVLWARLRMGWLAIVRRGERRGRERARRMVVSRQLERARERQEAADEVDRPPAGRREPLRVFLRTGDAAAGLRRVEGEPIEPPPQPAVAQPVRASVVPSDHGQPVPRASRRRSQPPPEVAAQRDLGFPVEVDRRALPPVNLLIMEEEKGDISETDLVRLGEVIRDRCAEFGVEGQVTAITPGPVITVYEFQPAPGVKVSQIVNLQDDLALSLRAEAIRIDRIPGRSTLGIEVPNARRSIIRLGKLLAEEEFQRSPSPLTMAIGRTLHGEPYFRDLATMPHLLVAGATGSGKSVGLQTMITSIIYKADRDQVKFIFIDPKRIELGVYADIPHLKAEVVVEPKKAANALRWAVSEMERRYRLLAEVHVRSIDYYNRAISDPAVQRRLALRDEIDGESAVAVSELQPLPYFVIVIDELADLMMVASAEVEISIARLAQMARAVGIHLIVATQRPSVDVLTGTIKANFPCRISFATATRHDSRTILDQVGSEKLLGKGDMLFLPPGSSRPIRLHGAYVSEQETAALVRWLKRQGKPELDPAVVEPPVEERGGGGSSGDYDPLFDDAARLVVAEGRGSASFLQRRMRLGFSRAARLIDSLEQDGILGPAQGSKPREALVKPDYFDEIDRHES